MVKSPDCVMRSGDLANDVARGICELVNEKGRVVSFSKLEKLHAGLGSDTGVVVSSKKDIGSKLGGGTGVV